MGGCRRNAFLGLILMLLLPVHSCFSPAVAKRPIDSYIAGFMAAALEALITGEFAGRRPSQVDVAMTKRICEASDYDTLRTAAKDSAAFDELRRHCQWVETSVDAAHVRAIAYPPSGYCEILKDAFYAMIADQLQRNPHHRAVIFEYKGSYFNSTSIDRVRAAQIEATCGADGVLWLTAPRKRR